MQAQLSLCGAPGRDRVLAGRPRYSGQQCAWASSALVQEDDIDAGKEERTGGEGMKARDREEERRLRVFIWKIGLRKPASSLLSMAVGLFRR